MTGRPDRTKAQKVTIKYPAMLESKAASLTMKAPKVQHWMEAAKLYGDTFDHDTNVIAHLCGVTPQEIADLHIADSQAVHEAYQFFKLSDEERESEIEAAMAAPGDQPYRVDLWYPLKDENSLTLRVPRGSDSISAGRNGSNPAESELWLFSSLTEREEEMLHQLYIADYLRLQCGYAGFLA